MSRAIPPAAERAYEYVKNRIIDGTIAESSMLSEGEVAQELSVSRTPIREAFLKLEVEGFLKLYPKRGALVTPISSKDIREVFEARKLIDVHAAQRICSLDAAGREEVCAQLDASIELQQDALGNNDLAAYALHDAQFHQIVMEYGANDILADLGRRLRERQQRFTATSVGRNADRARGFVEGHRRLTDALRRGDFETYQAEFHLHITDSRSQL